MTDNIHTLYFWNKDTGLVVLRVGSLMHLCQVKIALQSLVTDMMFIE